MGGISSCRRNSIYFYLIVFQFICIELTIWNVHQYILITDRCCYSSVNLWITCCCNGNVDSFFTFKDIFTICFCRQINGTVIFDDLNSSSSGCCVGSISYLHGCNRFYICFNLIFTCIFCCSQLIASIFICLNLNWNIACA